MEEDDEIGSDPYIEPPPLPPAPDQPEVLISQRYGGQDPEFAGVEIVGKDDAYRITSRRDDPVIEIDHSKTRIERLDSAGEIERFRLTRK